MSLLGPNMQIIGTDILLRNKLTSVKV